ncbi:MAG: GNAT family N-acetyltransferase [Xenococcaceae cyanobacterium]
MIIRDASETDLPRIVEIYNDSIPDRLATADIEPVSIASRIAWFHSHNPHTRPIWVMETEGIIVGWLSFNSFYGRPAYQKTVELSLYVDRDRQRQGIGTKLLERGIRESPNLGLSSLLGFIFAHNEPSLRLFQRYQFQQWGYLPKVAELDGVERDVVILGRRIEVLK